jgi:hypothetical protein
MTRGGARGGHLRRRLEREQQCDSIVTTVCQQCVQAGVSEGCHRSVMTEKARPTVDGRLDCCS